VTTAPVFDRPTVDWERDRWKRPKIKPPTGETWTSGTGKVEATRPYTRVTTFAGALDDSQGLVDWKAAQALLGASRRPDYMLAAAACQSWDQDKDTLRELVEKAAEAAGESASAIGTALHAFTERMDRGEPVGFVPEPYRPHLARYEQIIAPLTFTHHEVRTVNDQLQVAGTPDRFGYCSLPDPDGVVDKRRVIDTKSGKLDDYRVPKISAQLAIYAHSALYDPTTGARTPLPDLCTRWGLIVHLPAKATAVELEAGAGDLYWVNLDHGWAGAEELAGRVRAWRKVRGGTLLVPARAPEPAESTEQPATGGDVPQERVDAALQAHAILGAITTADLGLLWKQHGATWDQELQALAAERHTELKQQEDLAGPRAALAAALRGAHPELLHQLWTEYGDTPTWTEEHSTLARERHQALAGGVAA
jgi:hypothetical protein